MKVFLLLCCLSLLACNRAEKLRILVTAQHISYSHVKFQGQLADILAAEGHYVHYVIHELRPITADGANLAKVTRFHSSVAKQESGLNPILGIFQNHTAYDDAALIKFWQNMAQVCKELLEDTEHQEMLKAEKFDIAIGQEYDPCTFVLFQELGIKAVTMATPTAVNDDLEYILGIPIQRSYNNFIFNGYTTAPYLTFPQRVGGAWEVLSKYMRYGSPMNYPIQKAIDDHFGKGAYDLSEVLRSVSIIFSNGHELIDTSRPTLSKIVPIGGIAFEKPKALAPEVEAIMSSAKQGVVFFSWGSQFDLSILPRDLKLNFFNAFAKFPEIEFIIKYTKNLSNEHDFVGNYPNIHCFTWFDQTSILNHPKTLAFITHGGRNSLAESLTAGVPTISVPLFADQYYNSAVYQYRGVGIALNLPDLVEDRIVKALKKVIYDKKIRTNSQTLKQKLELQPFPPRDRFIKYVEFAAKFQDFDELNLPGAKLNFFWAYNLDAILFILSLPIVAIFITYYIIKKAVFIFNSNGKISKPKVKSS